MSEASPTAPSAAWRSATRAGGLIFCAAVGAFLIDIVVLSPLIIAAAKLLRGVESIALRLLLGALVMDGAKLCGLLPAAFLIGRGLALSRWTAATLLVLLTQGLHAITAVLLEQGAWLWGSAGVLACRLAMTFLLIWACATLLGRRRRAPAPEETRGSKLP